MQTLRASGVQFVRVFHVFILNFSDTVLSMGMVQQLVSVLRSPHSSVHEHVLGALCWLVMFIA